ncbi:MAG TPA: HAD family hydrolase [Firmicutes bacterium]|nr:HAD family hydrolase [Bacillota bacterium]
MDGTLLNYDRDYFLGKYMELLAMRVSSLVEPRRFIKQLISSTDAMVKSLDPGKTNKQVFVEDFFPKIGIPEESLMPIFDDFYKNEFRLLSSYVRPVPEARQVMEDIFRHGLDVVIATNPVFPLSAIRERLSWGGLADFDYKLITSYETMHFCKPNKEYYQEILDKIMRSPGECLMVGNDTEEDLSAGALGIKTYLVTDCLRGRCDESHKPDHSGTFAELASFIKCLLTSSPPGFFASAAG